MIGFKNVAIAWAMGVGGNELLDVTLAGSSPSLDLVKIICNTVVTVAAVVKIALENRKKRKQSKPKKDE